MAASLPALRNIAAARRRHGVANRIVHLSQNVAQTLPPRFARHLTLGFHHNFGLALLLRAQAAAPALRALAAAAPRHEVLCRNFAPRPHRVIALAALMAPGGARDPLLTLGRSKPPWTLDSALAAAVDSPLMAASAARSPPRRMSRGPTRR